MTTTLREQLLHEIDDFLKLTGMDPTSFGEKVLNDRAFVHRLREGSDVRTRTVDRIRTYIAEQSRPLARRKPVADARTAA